MIAFDEYAGEKHLVEEFITYTRKNPIRIADGDRHLFIWGYEIWLPEGGKNNGPGRIDLIGTDDGGLTWLIEAKHSLNFELSPAVWEGQILRYRTVLAKTPADDLFWQTNRYLTGRAEVSAPFPLSDNDSLYAAFAHWADRLQPQKTKIASLDIYSKMLFDIQNQNVISVLLADTIRKKVWEGRPRDNKGYAYFACSGVGTSFKLETLWDHIPFESGVARSGTSIQEKKWADIEREKRDAAPAPDTIRPMLTKEVVGLYDRCLVSLSRLGWNGKYLQNEKSFVITYNTKFGPPMRVNIGLPDYDAKSHKIENRLAGGAGFKFDISLKSLLRSEKYKDMGLAFAMRLIEEANYRARGAGQHLGVRVLSTKEFSTWDGDLHHWTKADERDFIGRPIDREDMEAVFKILSDLIDSGYTVGKPPTLIEKILPKLMVKTKLSVTIDDAMSGASDMKKLFAALNLAMSNVNLRIVYAGAKETVEIRLPDEKYPFAYGSIQYCHPKSGEYLELRFKRVHLRHAGVLEQLDLITNKPYRNDVSSANPEAIRFQFRKYDDTAVDFIEEIAQVVGVSGKKTPN